METNNETRNSYSKKLADNLQAALPKDKIQYFGGKIYVYLSKSVGEKTSLKGWLYMLLEGLPEIEYPIERIQFIVYQAGSMDLITVINPSKFDILALNNAIDSGLNFSSPPPQQWELEPLPLDHPYYTEEGWLQEQLEYKAKNKTKNITFNDVKDLPNVQPILEDIRKRGAEI